MTNMTNRETLCDMGYEDSIVFENPDYDSAIIGVTDDERVVYDYDKMIAFLEENDKMSEMDAADFISYSTMRALPYIGDGAPIIMYSIQ